MIMRNLMHVRIFRSIYRRGRVLRRWAPIRKPILLNLKEFKIYIQLNDWSVGLRIAVKRGYESHVTGTMRPLLKQGMVVLDIGANIGFYTLLAAARVGESGKVLAFEPGENNCRLIRMSLA